jgi:hypothetical protein
MEFTEVVSGTLTEAHRFDGKSGLRRAISCLLKYEIPFHYDGIRTITTSRYGIQVLQGYKLQREWIIPRPPHG